MGLRKAVGLRRNVIRRLGAGDPNSLPPGFRHRTDEDREQAEGQIPDRRRGPGESRVVPATEAPDDEIDKILRARQAREQFTEEHHHGLFMDRQELLRSPRSLHVSS